MEMILRAPKLSDERRRLPAVPAQPQEPVAPAPVADSHPLAQDTAASPPQNSSPEALDGARLEELAQLDALLLEREAAELRAREKAEAVEEAERELERQRECERQLVLEQELARDEARRRAYDEGLEQGRADGLMEVAKLRAILASIEIARDAWLGDAEDDLVAIAYEAVCRVCGPALATPDGVREHVKLTLQQVRGRELVTVRLAAADVEKLRELSAADRDIWDSRRVDLVADASLEAGGCVVETANGTLDAQLRRQFEQLLDVLTAARRSGKVEA